MGLFKKADEPALLGCVLPSLIVILTIVFGFLRIFKIIKWGFWWVVSPIWITLGFGFILFIWVFIRYYRDVEKNKK